MMNARSFSRFLAVVALCGAANGFAPQPSSLSKATLVSAPATSSSLHVWNPFVKDIPAPVVVKEDPVPGPIDTQNYIAAGVWAALIGWAFLLAPGELGAAGDSALAETLISQPTPRPESVNEIFFAVWNCFAVVPLLIGALEAPVGRGQRLPAAPFLLGSAAFGYFALGPYFATRTVRTDPVDREDLGFASKNIFESKIFAGLLSAIAISIPFTSELFTCDLSAAAAGFIDFVSTSRFAAVSTVDITIMSALVAVLVFEDAKRRGWEDKALPLLGASILLPVVGPSLYLVARPSLDDE